MKVQIRSNIISGGSFSVPDGVDCFAPSSGVHFRLPPSASFFKPFRDCLFFVDTVDKNWTRVRWQNSDRDAWIIFEF